MKRLKLIFLLLLAGIVAAQLLFWSKNDYIRVITETIMPKPALRYGSDEELLAYIVSQKERELRWGGDADLLIFGILNTAPKKSIDMEDLFGPADIEANGHFIDIYGKNLRLGERTEKIREEELSSGFDIGRRGLVFKLVIPTGKRVVNIMEFGVEPDQTEEIEKMNLTPKANIQVVIPIN